MAQLNINKLYETARKKELSKYENFDKILRRCHNKITHYAENKKTECLYNIPEFILGTPLFNRTELQEYIISSLINVSLIFSSYISSTLLSVLFIIYNINKYNIYKKLYLIF